MATNTVTYTVKAGDTLSQIALDFRNKGYKKVTVNSLVKLNNIPNKDLIYIGQVLIISGKQSTTTKKKETNQVKIDHFGMQANSNGTLFVTWTWSKSDTEKYEVLWEYYTANKVWFIGNKGDTKDKQSTYQIPQNATKVRVKVKPVCKEETVNGQKSSKWTGKWSEYKTYTPGAVITIPPAPTVEIVNGTTLTAELNNLDQTATYIEFQIVKDNSKVYKTVSNVKIVTSRAAISCNGLDLGAQYKVRCRAYITKNDKSTKKTEWSGWSPYSENKNSAPSVPSITKCVTKDKTSILVEWSEVKTADLYHLQYVADDETYFGISSEVKDVDNIDTNKRLVPVDQSGKKYFFRVRAKSDNQTSGWSKTASCTIGTPPSPPTTWSSTTTAIVGEKLTLYWIHNSEDGSAQKNAEIKMYINGVEQPSIPLTFNEDDENTTSYYEVDTSSYTEGTTIQWKVRTAGVTGEYSKYSTERTIDVYARPSMSISLTDVDDELVDIIESFPFTVSTSVYPPTQQPIGYHLSIVSNDIYETVDNIGNEITINEGEEVFSQYYDINEFLTVNFLPSMVNLESNINYTVKCTVSMDSGLSADASVDFTVSWTDDEYAPNAEISINPDTVTASIRPYCEVYHTYYYKVNSMNDGTYVVTTEKIDAIDDGYSIDDLSTTGEIIYYSESKNVYFTISESEDGYLVEGITLSVYRREFDGSFVELATGIENTSNIWIQDPHPSLDYARYRIVAVDNSTGAISYTDIPGYPVGEGSIIIQWDEQWSYFDVSDEDELEQPPWSGSLLRLPYNIDVSDNNEKDVSHVEYIGRKRKVSYYGTQLGETATWNVVIDKNDKETLYALRRLRIWMGDVYVREPSGSGYWASIKVTFSQKHKELTIPVTLDITRVEGGI